MFQPAQRGSIASGDAPGEPLLAAAGHTRRMKTALRINLRARGRSCKRLGPIERCVVTVLALVAEGLVRAHPVRGHVPTLMVVTRADRERWLGVDGALVEEVSGGILRRLPQIHGAYDRLPGFRGVPFERASLFVLSNVLLDNWQINRVGERYLREPRALRDGKRYYFAMLELDPGQRGEAFGIYGNTLSLRGRQGIGLYGNRRNEIDLAALSWPQLERQGAPVGSLADHQQLTALGGSLTGFLVSRLRRHEARLRRQYRESPYSDEVTWPEYFIWWYHLFYTAVTDHLVARGAITLPPSGVFVYLIRT